MNRTHPAVSPEDDRLPTFHRTIRLPGPLWAAVKALAGREGRAVREVVHAALDAELLPLVEALRGLGLDGGRVADKLVRLPMDDNVVGRINHGRRRTEVAAVELLTICLLRHVTELDGMAGESIAPSATARGEAQ